jgi:hypothetical protein
MIAFCGGALRGGVEEDDLRSRVGSSGIRPNRFASDSTHPRGGLRRPRPIQPGSGAGAARSDTLAPAPTSRGAP